MTNATDEKVTAGSTSGVTISANYLGQFTASVPVTGGGYYEFTQTNTSLNANIIPRATGEDKGGTWKFVESGTQKYEGTYTGDISLFTANVQTATLTLTVTKVRSETAYDLVNVSEAKTFPFNIMGSAFSATIPSVVVTFSLHSFSVSIPTANNVKNLILKESYSVLSDMVSKEGDSGESSEASAAPYSGRGSLTSYFKFNAEGTKSVKYNATYRGLIDGGTEYTYNATDGSLTPPADTSTNKKFLIKADNAYILQNEGDKFSRTSGSGLEGTFTSSGTTLTFTSGGGLTVTVTSDAGTTTYTGTYTITGGYRLSLKASSRNYSSSSGTSYYSASALYADSHLYLIDSVAYAKASELPAMLSGGPFPIIVSVQDGCSVGIGINNRDTYTYDSRYGNYYYEANENDTITLRTQSTYIQDGYRVDVVVKDSAGTTVALEEHYHDYNYNYDYYDFTMPASAVTVSVTYKETVNNSGNEQTQ